MTESEEIGEIVLHFMMCSRGVASDLQKNLKTQRDEAATKTSPQRSQGAQRTQEKQRQGDIFQYESPRSLRRFSHREDIPSFLFFLRPLRPLRPLR